MATLFNTKIKDTYQSLLKLEDNTILTTTSKNITDGLGNASPLYMSTTQVRIGSTSASALYWDNVNNRLGIGTSSPTAPLEVRGTTNNSIVLRVGGLNSGRDFTFNPYYATNVYGGLFSNDSGNITLGASLGTDNGSGIGIILGAPSGTRTALLQLKGTGSTSATASLLVQNSSANTLLQVRDDGLIVLPGNTGLNFSGANAQIFNDGGSGGTITFAMGGSTYFRVYQPKNAGSGITSGEINTITTPIDYGWSSGSASPNLLSLNPSINNTGAYSGGTFRGIYYNPTIYSLVGTTHIAIQTVTGNVILGSTSGNLLLGTTTDNGFKVNVNGSVNIAGGSVLNFANSSTQCWITTAGGGTGLGTRSLNLPGTGGQSHWIFYNTAAFGIQVTDASGDSLYFSPGQSSSNFAIMSLFKSAASNRGGGGFIFRDNTSGSRTFSFGNPASEFGDETGVHTKIQAGAGGTAGGGTYGNGGHIYLEGGAAAFGSNSPGNILISTNITGSKVGIGEASPSAKLQVKGNGSTSATSSLLVQNSSGTELLKVTDDGLVTGAAITATNNLRGANGRLNIYSSGNQLIITNPYVGNYFYIGPDNVCGVDNAFRVPNLNAGNLSITANSYPNGSNMTLGTFTSNNTGINTGLIISSNYVQGGAGGPNYGKQVKFYDNLTNNNVQCDLTFLYVNPTINYTATANGQIVGFDFNPVVTAVTANTKVRAFQSSVGGVYINTTTYQASAILQADSTTQGMLPPRMTDAQIRAIASPVNGLIAYNTTIDHLCVYQGGAWVKINHSPM